MSLFAQQNKALPDKEPFHPTRIIAKFAERGKAGAQAAALQQQGLKIQRQFSLLPQVAVLDLADPSEAKAAKAPAPADRSKRLEQRIAALRATGLFEYVEPDYVRRVSLEPTDAAYTDGTLWALHNFGQNGGVPGADIGAAAAWDITTGSTNVIVAIVDTGIRYTHQDLTAQMWRDPAATNFICGTNAVAGNSDPMDDSVDQYGDPEGHGTHVAGTIGAAANDGNPHVGVAWNVRLMACKFIGPDGGFVSDEIECLQFALAKGARIINASYGDFYYSQAEYEAIRSLRDRGVLFVAAAGNNALNDDSWLRSYPASLDLYNIIAVAAVDRADNLAYFSNYGQSTVHLGAPGVDIFSCINSSNTAYASYAGTSMATPHVSGAAALLLARYPNATLTELRRRILDGVVQIPSLTNKTATGGRLNLYNSLVTAPKGILEVEVSPRPGQALPAGKTATIYAIVTDLLPVTNATVTASIAGFTKLTLLDDGTAPDALAGDGVYTLSFFVPTNLTTLQVAFQVSAPGWPDATNFISYPVGFPPPNDNFASRIAISTNLCQMTVTGSNFNASMEVGEPLQFGQIAGHSVWWSWTAPASGPVCVSTVGSSIYTVLAIYTNQVLSNLALVGADYTITRHKSYSEVRFDAVAGTEYEMSVDGYLGAQGQLVLSVLPLIIPLEEAVDCPGLTFTSGGNTPWLGQTCVVREGPSAARSGPIERGGESWMESSIPVAGTLTFWWKVSSGSDQGFLTFSVNGVQQVNISGELDWQQKVFVLGAGSNVLRWTYSRDYVGSPGQDAGWLDAVSFVPVRSAIPQKLGDLDGDGQPTVLDMTLLVGYLRDTNPLWPEVAVFADVNNDGIINSNDIPALANAILGRTSLLPALDTNSNGIPDVLEPLIGSDPKADFDMDGLSNAYELLLGTDPMRADTDGDGWSDDAELAVGSNPLDANSRPYMMVVSSPSVAFMLPANQGAGGLTNNTVVALPPVSLMLPADQGSDGLTWNTTVALPPVALMLPWDIGAGGLALNATVALPPVSLMLPADQGASGLTNNTVIAMPPVRVELQSP
jgi:subtilisin family serine protease